MKFSIKAMRHQNLHSSMSWFLSGRQSKNTIMEESSLFHDYKESLDELMMGMSRGWDFSFRTSRCFTLPPSVGIWNNENITSP